MAHSISTEVEYQTTKADLVSFLFPPYFFYPDKITLLCSSLSTSIFWPPYVRKIRLSCLLLTLEHGVSNKCVQSRSCSCSGYTMKDQHN